MSQPKKRQHRRAAPARAPTEVAPPPRPQVPADRLLKSVAQRKQYVAMLFAAVDYINASFVPAPGSNKPRALLQDRSGRIEPADLGVVNQVTMDLRAQGETLHRQLIALLDKNLDAIELDEVPVIETHEEQLADQPGMPPLPTIRRDHEEDRSTDEHHGDRL